MTVIALPTSPLPDDDLLSWVQEAMTRLLGMPGAVRSVRVERYPGERMVIIDVQPSFLDSARTVAQLLRLELVKAEPSAGLFVR